MMQYLKCLYFLNILRRGLIVGLFYCHGLEGVLRGDQVTTVYVTEVTGPEGLRLVEDYVGVTLVLGLGFWVWFHFHYVFIIIAISQQYHVIQNAMLWNYIQHCKDIPTKQIHSMQKAPQSHRHLTNTYSIDLTIDANKLTINFHDFIECVKYVRQFSQDDLNGQQITLQDIMLAFSQPYQLLEQQQRLQSKGQDKLLYIPQYKFGQIIKIPNTELKSYKIDKGGRITIFITLQDRRSGRLVESDCCLILGTPNKIQCQELVEARLRYERYRLRREFMREIADLRTKIIDNQERPAKSNEIWDLFVYPGATTNTAKIGNNQFRCSIGKNGATADKKQGDGKTPVGTYPLRQIWFRKDKITVDVHDILLTTGLPLHPITPNDGWCDEPISTFYNKHVDLRTFDKNISHENLWRQDDLYDCFIVVGFNDNPIVPGKGSAIFVHIAREGYTGTAGCVAFSRGDLWEVMRGLRAYSKITVYGQEKGNEKVFLFYHDVQ